MRCAFVLQPASFPKTASFVMHQLKHKIRHKTKGMQPPEQVKMHTSMMVQEIYPASINIKQ